MLNLILLVTSVAKEKFVIDQILVSRELTTMRGGRGSFVLPIVYCKPDLLVMPLILFRKMRDA